MRIDNDHSLVVPQVDQVRVHFHPQRNAAIFASAREVRDEDFRSPALTVDGICPDVQEDHVFGDAILDVRLVETVAIHFSANSELSRWVSDDLEVWELDHVISLRPLPRRPNLHRLRRQSRHGNRS